MSELVRPGEGSPTELEIPGTSPFDVICRTDDDGEFWSARELMPLLGYDSWRRFEDAIERGRVTCKTAGRDVAYHFAATVKVIKGGRWGEQAVSDVRLTRYACYLVAMSGESSKPEVARAKEYFAERTRAAEVAELPKVTSVVPDISTPSGLIAMADMLAATARRLAVAEEKVTELAPAASAWHGLASKTGDISVSEAAKALKRAGIDTGPNRLFRTLNELGWTWKDGRGDWRVKQSAIEIGRLSERLTGTYEHPETGLRMAAPPQVRVTFKGLDTLHAHFTGVRPLPVRRQLTVDGETA